MNKRSILSLISKLLVIAIVFPQAIPARAAWNDNFADAMVIAATPFAESIDLTDATMEAGEPLPSCAQGYSAGQTVWYRYSPAQDGVVKTSVNSYTVPFLAVYSGDSLDSLLELSCGWLQQELHVNAVAGQSYYFQVGNVFSEGGLVDFQLNLILPPGNDSFASPVIIDGLPLYENLDVSAATIEPGEPMPPCAGENPGQTVWYSFTPGETGSYMITLQNWNSFVGIYTGTSFQDLSSVGCGTFVNAVHLEAGTAYAIQVGAVYPTFDPIPFTLEAAPPPYVYFYYDPSDPSIFDLIQFTDTSVDPAGAGWQSLSWDFGDGTTAEGYGVAHQYAQDGDYNVTHEVITTDGRSASITQVVSVRTHDVAIARFTVPEAARALQTRQITVGVTNARVSETVHVELYVSRPGTWDGWELIGQLDQYVPVRPGGRTTNFVFSYTFTPQDASLGKVNFKAVALIFNARDALPPDNTAISLFTRVN